MELTRRSFLRSAGAATLMLSLDRLGFAQAGPGASGAAAAPPIPDYRTWEDVLRKTWTWDRVVHSTHNRANCMSACAWNVYVKDGIVWREEQAHAYDEGGRGGAPDFFPRGCQKGACYSKLMVSPQRLRYPLERVGERGSGKWKRISWDEALDKVADGIIAAATAHGADTVVATPGPNFDHGPDSAAEFRFLHLLGATTLDTFSGIGDMPVGMIQTYGMFMNDGTTDDYFRSDYIVLWSANPLYTRIPDMHFLTEARYRGAAARGHRPRLQRHRHARGSVAQPEDPDRPGAGAGDGAGDHRREAVQSRTTCGSRPTCRSWCAPTPDASCASATSCRAAATTPSTCGTRQQGAAVLAPGSQGMKKPTLALGDDQAGARRPAAR